MTSEERIDELEKRVRIMELKNDNLGKRLDIIVSSNIRHS